MSHHPCELSCVTLVTCFSSQFHILCFGSNLDIPIVYPCSFAVSVSQSCFAVGSLLLDAFVWLI